MRFNTFSTLYHRSCKKHVKKTATVIFLQEAIVTTRVRIAGNLRQDYSQAISQEFGRAGE